MSPNDMTTASLDRIEAQLLADLDVVRRMKVLLARHQPPATSSTPVAAAAAPAAEWSIAPATSTVTSPSTDTAPAYVPPPRHPNLDIKDAAVAVRQIVATLEGNFGIGEVKKQLVKQSYRTFGDSSLRSALQSMHEKGELVQTARGLGRGGNKYARPSAAPSAAV